jgi:surface antigen
MNTKIIVSFFAISSLLLSSCVTPPPTKQTGGAVLGGVLGGIAGAQVGKGKGRTVATIVGALAGALLGGSIGSSMDAVDLQQANQALEERPDGQKVAWTNPNTNNEYEVTPTRTYETNQGVCRDYETVAMIEGQRQVLYGKACRQPDGSWKSVGN